MPRHCTGLTAIEVMLALAIVAILTTLGSISYSRYTDKVKTARAIVDITTLQALINDYATNNNYDLPADLSVIGQSGKLDPWKRAYVYTNLQARHGNGAARKDHRLNPINSDYDLYSVGPDGASHTQVSNRDSLDDIIRATDGKFIGVAKDF